MIQTKTPWKLARKAGHAISLTTIAKALVIGALSSATLYAVMPATAYASCGCTSATNRWGERNRSTTIEQAKNTRQFLGDKIDYMRDRLIETITRTSQDSTAGIARQQAESAKAQSESAVELQKAKDKERIEESVPGLPCGSTGAANGPRSGGMGSSRSSSGTGNGYQPSGNIDERFAKVMGSLEITDTALPPPRAPEEQLSNFGVGGCLTFAKPGTRRSLICEQMGLPVEGKNPQFADADIKAETLFNGPQIDGVNKDLLSVPRDGITRDARMALMTSLQHVDTPPSPYLTGMKTQQGTTYSGLVANYLAMKSAATWPMRHYDALTSSPGANDSQTKKQLNDAFKALMDDEAAGPFVQSYLANAGPGQSALSPDDVSPLELMTIEVERRIGNPEWVKLMAGADDKEKETELLFIQAYALRLDFERYKTQLQTNVLLGQIMNMLIESTLRPKIDAQVEKVNMSSTTGSQGEYADGQQSSN